MVSFRGTIGFSYDCYYVASKQDFQPWMRGLNLLKSLLNTIEDFLQTQGGVSKNSFEDDEGDGINDFCSLFNQVVGDVDRLATLFCQEHPPFTAFIAPHQAQINQWLRDMTQAARFFVYDNHRRRDAFEVCFEASFLADMKRARRQVVGWWFDYEALTRQQAQGSSPVTATTVTAVT